MHYGGIIMAIKHTAVSYYGFNYVEHAEKDFLEMKEHGCDTVILAITEFDMDFWFPNINAGSFDERGFGFCISSMHVFVCKECAT